MRFRSYTGAVHKRARTYLGPTREDIDKDVGNAFIIIAVEFALTEAGKGEEESAIDALPTEYIRVNSIKA